MWRIFSQVTVPPSDDPGPFGDVDKLFAPISSGFWWFVTHRLIWLAIAVAVVLGLWGAASGNKNRMAQSRSSFGGIVGTVVCAVLAAIAVTYVLSKA